MCPCIQIIMYDYTLMGLNLLNSVGAATRKHSLSTSTMSGVFEQIRRMCPGEQLTSKWIGHHVWTPHLLFNTSMVMTHGRVQLYPQAKHLLATSSFRWVHLLWEPHARQSEVFHELKCQLAAAVACGRHQWKTSSGQLENFTFLMLKDGHTQPNI